MPVEELLLESAGVKNMNIFRSNFSEYMILTILSHHIFIKTSYKTGN